MVAFTYILNPCQKPYNIDIEKGVSFEIIEKPNYCTAVNINCTSTNTRMFLAINMLTKL